MDESADQTASNAAVPPNAEYFSPAYLESRRRALEAASWPKDIDEPGPVGPSGHAYAIRKSIWLTSEFRKTHRKGAMNITPQDVIDVLNSAGVKNWVLMGLHGYVGYMPEPRATQDVNVMVPTSQRKRAQKAIAEKWPNLVIQELSQVIRFKDPADLDSEGLPKPVVDLMLPWSPFQSLILKEYVVVEKETGHRLPTVEAALVSKYASMISVYRDRITRKNTMSPTSAASPGPTTIGSTPRHSVVLQRSSGRKARRKSSNSFKSHSPTSHFLFRNG